MINHIRPRYALALLLKKIKFSPAVLIRGARQTGKSFLVKNMFEVKNFKKTYLNLDQKSLRDLADRTPDTFVRNKEINEILIIDEAQKSPSIFDSIKAVIDEDRRPTQYLLLGSTEFSKLTRIRESLTGRASRLRLFPLTLSESLKMPLNQKTHFFHSQPRVSRNDMLRYFKRGGMPGLFGIKDPSERKEAIKSWIELTAERDCLNFDKIKIDSNLIYRILEQIAKNDDTSAGQMAKNLKIDKRKIETHLKALKTLFVIHDLEPHSLSTGKTQYFFADLALLDYYKASFEKKLKTYALNEIMAQAYYQQQEHFRLVYYRNQKGSLIDLLILKEDKIQQAIKIFPEESVLPKNLNLLKALLQKHPDAFAKNSKLIALTGILQPMTLNGVEIFPWECLS